MPPQTHPGRLIAAIIAVGFVLTVVATWGAARIDRNTEERLLQTQTRQAAAVLSTAISVIEAPLRSALDDERFADKRDAASVFERRFASAVGSQDQPFVSASLWHRERSQLRRVSTMGVSPGIDGTSTKGQRFLRHALASRTSVVEKLSVGDEARIAQALADRSTGYVVYTERAIPADRRAPVDRDSAFAELHYAIYLGRKADVDGLTTTDVKASDLPLDGITSRTEVPFGDTVLTLVMSPRQHLGSALGQRLPFILAVGGLLITAVAALVVRQLVRARSTAEDATEEQRELFGRLQRALLPQVNPDIPGMEIASRYVAGAQGVDIGGDWYSVIGVDEERFAFVVGDVSGHGVDAVAVMAHARFTLRAYLFDGDSPEEALEKSARQFDIATDDHMITAVAGIGNWKTGEIVLANAGHPPPLLVDEQADYVSMKVGLPLGVGPSSYEPTTFTLPVGATLISYTDGLIERRTEDLDTGLRRLADVVTAIGDAPLEHLVTQVLTELRDSDAVDDIAVLALRRVDS